jgi:hypothetical protein
MAVLTVSCDSGGLVVCMVLQEAKAVILTFTDFDIEESVFKLRFLFSQYKSLRFILFAHERKAVKQ